jgi:hypothetical protein
MEIAVFGDKRWDFFERSNRSSSYEDQVAANSESRIEFREFHRVIEGRATRHHSRARKNSIAMGMDNSFIYSSGEAEVVGVEDEPLHLASVSRCPEISAGGSRKGKSLV